jgi:hypothetical protein
VIRVADLLVQAGEILSGKVRLFGDDPVELNFEPAGRELHWTELEREKGWEKDRISA